MPKDSLFPYDEPVAFQVWHKRGRDYERVATVESNALGAILMTSHGFMGYARWQDNPAVTAMPGDHRSTTIGDVLIGPEGRSLELSADDGLNLKPIAPVDRSLFDAKGMQPGREETALERVERQLRDWKSDHAALWEDVFNEAGRLRVLEGELDWAGVPVRDKQAVIAREVDFTKITPDELDAAYQPSARTAGPTPDGFDRVAADPRRAWSDEGYESTRGPWDALAAEDRAYFLAARAVRHDVPFERFAAAARRMLEHGPGRDSITLDEGALRRTFNEAREVAEFLDAGFRGDLDRPSEPGRLSRPGPGEEAPLDRVERQIGHIKLRPDPHDFGIEELGPWDTGVSEEWERLPEMEKLSSLVRQVDWRDISPEVKRRLLEREVDFVRVPEQARQTLLGEAAGVASARESAPAPCAPFLPQGAELRVLPGRGNPVYWRERTFDIHDATGKIGHLAGYLGGPWSEAEFRLTHVELSEPGRHLTPGQWKDVLRGLAEQLPDAEYLGANRTGVTGDLSPAYEKLIRMPPAASSVAKDLPAPAAMAGGFGRAGGMEAPEGEAGDADTGAEKRRLPSPSQIIADPADYLPQPQPGKDNDLER